ncbi:MAG: GNAT family N-acetyltransferase [Actinomycetota bacterium]
MRIVDLEPGDPRWPSVLPVLRELRPHLDPAALAQVYAEGWPQGLRFTAVLGEDERCLAVAGWRVVATTSVLRKMYVDDLVTTAALRSGGVGALLFDHLEQRAREAGCAVLDLDSGVQRFDAHRFYLARRMRLSSHHFAKTLG